MVESSSIPSAALTRACALIPRGHELGVDVLLGLPCTVVDFLDTAQARGWRFRSAEPLLAQAPGKIVARPLLVSDERAGVLVQGRGDIEVLAVLDQAQQFQDRSELSDLAAGTIE